MDRQDVSPEQVSAPTQDDLAKAWDQGYAQALKEPQWDPYWDRPWGDTNDRTPNPYREGTS